MAPTLQREGRWCLSKDDVRQQRMASAPLGPARGSSVPRPEEVLPVNWSDDDFEELSKALARGVSRRKALRLVAASVASGVLSGLGLGHVRAAPNRCAQACAFEPKGPRQAACKQACKRCGGDLSRVCFGTEIICCPPDSVCCDGPAGTTCCAEGEQCCGGTCVEECPEGSFLDPETCECVPFSTCTTCADNPCGVDPLAVCGENPQSGFCLCAQTVDETCACVQPICGDLCAMSTDCPEGFACIVDECCGFATCAPLCETAAPATSQTAQRWG
jgi:hypothetical protein